MVPVMVIELPSVGAVSNGKLSHLDRRLEMATSTCPSCRRIIVWTGVLGVHAVLVVLFLRMGSHRAAAPNPDLESPLVLLLLERPAPEHVPALPAPSAARVHSPTRLRKAPHPTDAPVSLPIEPSPPRPP